MKSSISSLFIYILLAHMNDCDFKTFRSGLKLNDFISHFEPLHFNHLSFINQHTRLKRSAHKNKATNWRISLNFTAHQKFFSLILRPDNAIYSNDILFDTTNGKLNYDTLNVVTGELRDEEFSSVHGVITQDGLFDGTVSTRSEEYYIEPASRYFLYPMQFHSVIYKVSDVIARNLSQPCLTDILSKKSLTGSDTLDEVPKFSSGHKSSNFLPTTELPADRSKSFRVFSDFHKFHQSSSSKVDFSENDRRFIRLRKLSSQFSGNNYSLSNSSLLQRLKRSHQRRSHNNGNKVRSKLKLNWIEERAKKRTAIDPKKTNCMLYLQADHLFYKKMGSVDACIEQMTRHVQKVNNIYRVVDFDQDGYPDNISFMIKRIKVHTMEALNDPKYRFPSNYGVEKFLELFSEEDYDSFCLAYMFTYRDFEGGTLGLAWTGDLKNAGGVCEKNGHYRGSLKSLNTGIVTLLNYGKHVPPAVSHVTLAHEIGHNFGSPHDPENNNGCTPGGQDGNYIMFARATSGDKYNNQKFSPCSMKSISSVLSTKARGNKGCFTEPQESICGNEVVEKGEECDCGWEEDCEESCCFPMRSNPPRNEPPCTLRPSVICSPSQGPCCTKDCDLAVGTKCRDDNGCRSSSFCDGTGPKCPLSIHKPNRTICNQEFVCYMGECTGSICIAYGLEFCQCERKSYEAVTKSCELCCKIPGKDHTCKSSFEWNTQPYKIPDMFAKPGTPCNDYSGYCDVFQKCREVDPSGPLATLRKLLLSNESMKTLREWVVQHWWGALLLGVGFVFFLVLVVKVFGKKPERLKESDIDYNRPLNRRVDPCPSNQVMISAGYPPRPQHQRRSNTNRNLTTAIARQNGNRLGVVTAFAPGETSQGVLSHSKCSERFTKWV